MQTLQKTDGGDFTTTTYNEVEWSHSAITPKGGAVVFLRDAESDKEQFLPIYHPHSITLRDLAEEFNISSVLECDAEGSIQPRTVALDSPSDILHAGRHYIAHRDARSEAGANRVTFRGRIVVKEYELDHPTPISSGTSFMPNFSNKGGIEERTGPDDSSQDTKPHQATGGNPNKENELDGLSIHSLPRVATLGSTDRRKRPRADGVDQVSKDHPISHRHEAGCTAVGQVCSTSSNDSTCRGELSIPLECSQPDNQPVVRFLPFKADLHGDGVQVLIQLEDLKVLCEQVDTQEAEFLRRREGAEKILEESRNLLKLLKRV
ncbi:unnamed protein product [Phytomonas sp. Hart1]|nr:unnamed protein product [Phytomonas sp. Hart1]|eukprot:CCW68293.1 unnamed protein product [Phytomonas sp. isolate Hart1]